MKDQVPSADLPVPQFGMDNEHWFDLEQFSMNDDPEAEIDPRPNLFALPWTNFAMLYLDNWKIHHTSGQNWVRNMDMTMTNFQFSDNALAWTIKTSTPPLGGVKNMHNCIFVGFSRNTGHHYCNEREVGYHAYDLFMPRTCGTWDSPAEFPQNKHDTLPVSDTALGFTWWWKPAGDVYRAAATSRDKVIQGLAVYDTWVFQQTYNNIFYDYFGGMEEEAFYTGGGHPR